MNCFYIIWYFHTKGDDVDDDFYFCYSYMGVYVWCGGWNTLYFLMFSLFVLLCFFFKFEMLEVKRRKILFFETNSVQFCIRDEIEDIRYFGRRTAENTKFREKLHVGVSVTYTHLVFLLYFWFSVFVFFFFSLFLVFIIIIVILWNNGMGFVGPTPYDQGIGSRKRLVLCQLNEIEWNSIPRIKVDLIFMFLLNIKSVRIQIACCYLRKEKKAYLHYLWIIHFCTHYDRAAFNTKRIFHLRTYLRLPNFSLFLFKYIVLQLWICSAWI